MEEQKDGDDDDEEEEDDDEEDEEAARGKDAGEEGVVKGTRAEMEERLDYLNRLARGEVSDASTSSSEEDGDSSEESEMDVEDEDDDEVVDSRKLEHGPIPMGDATR